MSTSSISSNINNSFYVFVGSGSNSLSYYKQITNNNINENVNKIYGLGTTIFSTSGNSVAYNGSNIYVAVGTGSSNTIAYSYDGTTWVGLGKALYLSNGNCVIWNGTNFFAVGDNNSIIYSNNGTIWNSSSNTTFYSGNSLCFNTSNPSILVGSGTFNSSLLDKWVAVGSGTNNIATSTNGTQWTGLGTTLVLNCITNTTSIWVAGGNGTMYYSYNSFGWITGSSVSLSNVYGIKYKNGYFVVGGNSSGSTNSIYYSSNGISWTEVTFGTNYISSGFGADYNGTNTWVGVGNFGLTTPGPYNHIFYGDFYLGYNAYYNKSFPNINLTANVISVDLSTGRVFFDGASTCRIQSCVITTSTGSVSIPTTYTSEYHWTGSYSGVLVNVISISISADYNNYGGFSSNNRINGTVTFSGGSYINSYPIVYSTSNPPTSWNIVNNSIFTQGNDVFYGNSLFVAVGTGTNSIAYSSNGTVWSGLGNTIFSVAGYGIKFANNLWIALGDGASNSLAYSSNGTVWTGLGKTIFTIGYSLDYSSVLSLWISVGNGTNSIAYSSNGTQWTGLGSTIFTSSSRGISFQILGSTTNTLAYTYNGGTTWSGLGSTIFSVKGNGISYGNNIFVGTGEGTNTLAYSSNGSVWFGLGTTIFTTRGSNASFNINNNLFVSVGTGTNTIAYSSNGSIWTGLGTTIFQNFGTGIFWDNNRFIAFGSGTLNTIAYSLDGTQWTGLGSTIFTTSGSNGCVGLKSLSLLKTVQTYTFGPTISPLWVSLGTGSSNTISYSYDGINWIGLSTTIFNLSGNSIIWNGSIWVAYGSGTNNTISYSYDGKSWSGAGSSIFSFSGNSLIWTGKYFVGVGFGSSNSLVYSQNGINWTGLGSTIFYSGNGIAYNGNVIVSSGVSSLSTFVAVGKGLNTLAYSNNNATIYTGIGATIFTTSGNSLTKNVNLWVAVGSGTNSIAYSSNGINWTGLGTTIFTVANSITWNGTYFVAVGSGNYTIAYSSNGTQWTGLSNSIFYSVGNGITSNGSFLIASGDNLTMYVLTGSGSSNTLAYSFNNISSWTGLGKTIFSISGNTVTNDGTNLKWVAGGEGASNTLAYSVSGISTWVGIGKTIFDSSCNSIIFTRSNNFWIAVGKGSTNSIAYSINGTQWTGLGTTILFTGNAITSNNSGSMIVSGGNYYSNYIAFGSGTNTIAYTTFDLNNWVGLGTTVFTIRGNGGTSSSQIIVSVGQGTNSIAYSLDSGSTWTGLGTTIFQISGNGITYNGTNFISAGSGSTNTLAYSSNGTQWTGLGSSIFINAGNQVTSNNSTTTILASGQCLNYYVIVGSGGSNTISYSTGSITTFVGLGNTVFSVAGNSVINNGNIWVSLGQGINSIAYSTLASPTVWTGLGTTIFGTSGNAITWNGTNFVAVGNCVTNTIAYSPNGTQWTGLGKSIFYIGYGITSNSSVTVSGGTYYALNIAVGSGTNTISYYTYNNITSWTGLGTTVFSISGNSVVHNNA